MERCLAFECLCAWVPASLPVHMPGCVMACVAGCLGAPVPVCGVQSNEGTDSGGMEAPMERFLAFE